ncbi:flagellar filament capping protein FliD [Clostridium sp. WLY-B-L2]|uniref:Flagellar hook-associated protein 2 n=1 Tax=Clostridium aromativorans TaxID=2836848 RepID=A0ABS8N2I5_9CLOT|nr:MULTISPECIES: flagellar filament capping protein FliD [Clostridium]KAA8678172.1 flagellar filament capping protein FliD [Clostridium sp. HV4-5-A1G]MCC9293896.1 flagellar filament capping protein FliD [Clostridium aromativorans]
MADSTSSMPVGATGAGGGNMLRITGLNTGLDIDAMVKKMLTADQTKIDQAKQQQQLIQWRQEAYQSIIKDVKDLQSTYFDITNSTSYLLSSNSYNNMTASSSDATTVSGKASATATAGNYKILIKQLASAANLTGSQISAQSGSATKLSDLGISGNISLALDYNNGGTAGSKTVTFTATDSSTIQDLEDAIKNQTGGAVTAKFNELTGQFSIQTSTTGSSSTISVTDNNGVLSKLGITDKTGTGNDALVAIKEPGSSSYIVSRQSSNNFTVNGVTYSISDVNSTNSDISKDKVGQSVVVDAVADSPVSISVTQDTSKVHDLITNFIDKYNNLVGEIQDKLSEKKDYDYAPLTDAQKEEMSDTDITNWENKAKEGILRNDDNLQQLLDNLTSAFNTPVVDSSGKSVSTIYFGSIGDNALGIDTSDDYSEGAKLSITDEQKFTDALNNHADEIMKLFTTTSDSTDATDKFNQSGIFQRISDIIDKNVGVIGTTLNSGTLTKYANLQDDYSVTGGSGTGTLPDQIYQQQLLINTLTDRMNDDQTKYYNQFTQLEVAMEQLNAQQSTLSLYLG